MGKCPFDQSLQILKLPPAPAGVLARSGRAFRRFPLQLSKDDNKNSVQSALNAVFRSLPFRPPRRPALHRPPLPAARPGLACAAAMIRRRVRALYGPVTRRAGQHLPLSPIAFYTSFRASRAQNRLSDAHSKRTDAGSTYIRR